MSGQMCQGTVKSYNAAKGFGFIDYMGSDVFVHVKDCEGGAPQIGDSLSFLVEESRAKPGSMKAYRVTGGTGPLEGGAGCGVGKGGKGGKGGTGKGKTSFDGGCGGVSGGYGGGCCAGGMPGMMGSPVANTGSCSGTVKLFNEGKGWGFIEHEGVDIFVHIKDCNGCQPRPGDVVSFDIEESTIKPGSTKATNVSGGTAVPGEGGCKGGGKSKGGKAQKGGKQGDGGFGTGACCKGDHFGCWGGWPGGCAPFPVPPAFVGAPWPMGAPVGGMDMGNPYGAYAPMMAGGCLGGEDYSLGNGSNGLNHAE
eukprot:TRINITY_DN3139_c0_g4_i1.p1 TRINITY_DN3139_c0_g4~~TRINITY_DN3139_c0_g4_i1.p1  ORF type:complete len:308 (+),score=62.65 TRINITY_DN3139_c0_g4_i1:80-1003(+)